MEFDVYNCCRLANEKSVAVRLLYNILTDSMSATMFVMMTPKIQSLKINIKRNFLNFVVHNLSTAAAHQLYSNPLSGV